MANSKHLAIRSALAAAIGSVAGGRVHENRNFNLAVGVASQVHVNFRASTPSRGGISGAPLDWETELEAVVLARRDGSDEASDVADALWVEIFGLVMADQSLGGLAAYLEPGTVTVEPAEADTTTCRLTWTVTVQHRTDNNSIA